MHVPEAKPEKKWNFGQRKLDLIFI